MSIKEQIGLFLFIVGLSLVAAKASGRLAKEMGAPALMIGLVAGSIGHGLATKV